MPRVFVFLGNWIETVVEIRCGNWAEPPSAPSLKGGDTNRKPCYGLAYGRTS